MQTINSKPTLWEIESITYNVHVRILPDYRGRRQKYKNDERGIINASDRK